MSVNELDSENGWNWKRFIRRVLEDDSINSKQDMGKAFLKSIPDETCPNHRKRIEKSVKEFLDE